MGKTTPFHTDSPDYPPKPREVFHDHDDCSDGKQIKRWHRKPGMGYPIRKQCDEYVKLGEMVTKSECIRN